MMSTVCLAAQGAGVGNVQLLDVLNGCCGTGTFRKIRVNACGYIKTVR